MNNIPGSPFGMGSVGFVYFNNLPAANTSSSAENNQFIEFSNSDSPGGAFSPSNYSSPNQFRRRNFRGRKSSTFNRFQNVSYEYEPNNYSTSNNKNTNAELNRSGNSRNKSYFKPKQPTGSVDISKYYHPSMNEDPWTELENMLRIRKDSTEQNLSDDDSGSDANADDTAIDYSQSQ